LEHYFKSKAATQGLSGVFAPIAVWPAADALTRHVQQQTPRRFLLSKIQQLSGLFIPRAFWLCGV
jgi:hypothetical protein